MLKKPNIGENQDCSTQKFDFQNIAMRFWQGYIRSLVFCGIAFFCCTILTAQVGVGANFGIETDLYSGDIISGNGTDDWFYNNSSGSGVIDEATAISMNYAAQLAAGNNISFGLGQSLPNYFANNGYLWYSSIYGRDYIADNTDLTSFAGGKNGDNPMIDWSILNGQVPNKSDIVDSGVHMRRDGVLTTDDLWVNLMISTLSSSGNHFIDFELFVSEIGTSGSNFVNSGTDEGHTAWQFDTNGNVTVIGDMIIGFAYTGGGVSGVEVRLWVDRSIFVPGTSPGGTSTFTWGSNIDGGTNYGYGEINIPAGALLSGVNDTVSTGPPWGTTNTSGYTTFYEVDYFAEVGINFTNLGFDPRALFGPSAACDSPFSSIITKSRTSSSFTSSLKDFSGPYSFLGSAANSEVNTVVANANTVAPFDSCLSGETRTLSAEFNSPNAEYHWYSLTPGVVFPGNGLSEISGVAMYDVEINMPGEYQLGIAPLPGCSVVTNDANIVPVQAIPCAIDDYLIVVENSTNNTLSVLTNDSDLENDLDALSLNNSGLLQPTNGTVTISSGVLSYTPNTDYTGIDTFEYQICDTNDPALCDIGLVTVYIQDDSDNDGVPDYSDLDDDNDGIPDTEELNTILNNDQPACGGETVLDFSAASVLESGVDLQQGAVYRIPNVTSGTDALITVVQTFNATIAELDDNAAEASAFRPRTAFDIASAGDSGYIEYKINFVSSGGATPVTINKVFLNINDIDGNTDYSEQIWTDNPSDYTISNPTELTMNTDGSWVRATGGTTEYTGAGNTNPQVNFSVNYTAKTEISLRVGVEARIDNVSASGRQHNIEFNCITNYINPITYGIDNDSDGISNHLDLDSDNDGIYDAVESGHNQAHLDGVLVANFGPNGLGDLVETSPESGIINYTILNSDGTPPSNYLDGDSDDDGCSDANEAYNDPNADGGDNLYYGVGDPPPTDEMGRVVAASYPVPADLDSNAVYDAYEAILPVIDVQPVDVVICPGCEGSISISGTNVASYQWQWYDGTDWVNVTDTGIYSGSNSNTLTISNPTTSENGYQYRVLLYNSAYVCGPIISDVAVLHIRVTTVITNRKITYRVNKN